ncbi:MAG: hypothetical protein IPN76_23370 [Saprospiraceae bacterium]|nr:hypothetical protein [Saprospiraceae bacterium]
MIEILSQSQNKKIFTYQLTFSAQVPFFVFSLFSNLPFQISPSNLPDLALPREMKGHFVKNKFGTNGLRVD